MSGLLTIPERHQFELPKKTYENGRVIKKVCVVDANSSAITVKALAVPGLKSEPQTVVLSPFFVGKLAHKGMIIVISDEGKALFFYMPEPAIAAEILKQLA